MLIVISPAKTLDFETPPTTELHTTPDFIPEASQLIKGLRKLAPQDISDLMGISDKLGTLNYDRFQQWKSTFTTTALTSTLITGDAKQAILAFKGDVYTGLEAETFKARASKTTNIFSP